MSTLSRCTLVTAASAPPALAVPALASPAAASPPACTLPPDLVERFVRVRAWYLGYHKREEKAGKEVDRRFEATTGLTAEQWREINCDDPRWKELTAINNKIYADFSIFQDDEPEADELWNERWGLAGALIECEPRTVVDLAYQAEAWRLADPDIFCTTSGATADPLLRTFFRHLRALMPPPNDPTGLLSINIDSDDDAEA